MHCLWEFQGQQNMIFLAFPAGENSAGRSVIISFCKSKAFYKVWLNIYLINVIGLRIIADAGQPLYKPRTDIAPKMMIYLGNAIQEEIFPQSGCTPLDYVMPE